MITAAHTIYSMDTIKKCFKSLSCCNRANRVAPAPHPLQAHDGIMLAPIGQSMAEREQLAQDLAAAHPVEYQTAVLEIEAAKKRTAQ